MRLRSQARRQRLDPSVIEGDARRPRAGEVLADLDRRAQNFGWVPPERLPAAFLNAFSAG